MSEKPRAQTKISTYSNDAIYVRDKNLVEDLIGKLTFTEMCFFHIMQRMPSKAEAAVLDAALVTLMEHGLTPSAIATRMVYISSPESMQSAVAAGLLAVGSVFVGTMEGCAQLLDEMVHAEDGVEAAAQRLVAKARAERKPIPGFGHHLHKPDDPRSAKLLDFAESQGVPGRHIAAIRTLSTVIDREYGKHITINATGAIAAILSEIGVPWNVMRGFAVVSRSAGLVGHIREEAEYPAARQIWDMAEHEIPYTGEVQVKHKP